MKKLDKIQNLFMVISSSKLEKKNIWPEEKISIKKYIILKH